MKRYLAGLLLAAASCGALAQDYTGIWRADEDPNAFVQVTQRGESLVIVALSSSGEWDAYLGLISGNRASVATVIGHINQSLTVDFSSSTVAVATVQSCAPFSIYYACRFSPGTRITYRKIF